MPNGPSLPGWTEEKIRFYPPQAGCPGMSLVLHAGHGAARIQIALTVSEMLEEWHACYGAVVAGVTRPWHLLHWRIIDQTPVVE